MSRIITFSSLLSCLLLCLCVLAIGAAGITGESAPASARVANHQPSSVLPARLIAIVAKTLAARSPDTWRAHTTTKQDVAFSNPVQHLIASFSHDATTLQLGDKQHDQLVMQLTAYRVGNSTQPLTTGIPSANGNRVELSYGTGLTEWYLNSPLGLEQGFTIAAPPKFTRSSHSLALVFSLHGNLTPVLIGKAVEFKNATGQRVLRYGNLLAWDARHHALSAQLRLQDRSLLLSVNTAGAHFPVTVDPMFSLVATFSDPAAAGGNGDGFGISVALSADGSTALIGANGAVVSGTRGAGAAYVFTQSNGTWSSAPTHTFNDPLAAADDFFGASVALSADGNTALIGALQTTISGLPTGAAYVYTRSTSTWPITPTQTFSDPGAAAGDSFGSDVALSGDGNTALIGALETTVSGNTFEGAAYVFTRSNGTWSGTPTQTFSDPAATDNDNFGVSVALSSDGSTALIGALDPTIGSGSHGAAYLYSQSNGIWSGTPTQTFSVPAGGELFGNSVALSGDGSTALIGAVGTFVSSNNGGGVAYVYTRSNDHWPGTPTQTFSDPGAGSTLFGGGDGFGAFVALSADGATALIEADATANGTTSAAYVYTQNNGAWPSTPIQAFSDLDLAAVSIGISGNSVALSADGNTGLIGANKATVSGFSGAGAAYVFTTATTTPPSPKSGGGGGGFGWLSLLLLAPLVRRKKIFPSP